MTVRKNLKMITRWRLRSGSVVFNRFRVCQGRSEDVQTSNVFDGVRIFVPQKQVTRRKKAGDELPWKTLQGFARSKCLVMHAKQDKPFDVWHSTATLGSMGDILATFRLVFPEGTYRMLRRCSSKRKRLSCAWNERQHEIIAWVSHRFHRTHRICSLAPLIVISFKHWWQLAAKTTDLSVIVPQQTRVT